MVPLIDYQINLFFQNNILDFRTYPIEEIAQYYQLKNRKSILDLSKISSLTLQQEIKDFLRLIFTNKATFTYTSRYMTELYFFITFVSKLEITSIFDTSNEDMRNDYLCYRNVVDNTIPKRLVNSIYFHLTQFYDTRTGFNRDIWNLNDFKIENIRLNPTSKINSISFIFVSNESNKNLLKEYIKYLISCTSYSISTIVNILSICGNFSNFIEKSILDTISIDCENYFHKIDKTTKRADVYSKHVLSITNYIEYLIIQGLFKNHNPAKGFKQKHDYEYKETALSDFVIQQIFSNLHQATLFFQAMYIINFCTGMRISSICQLKNDCLFSNDGHYFIKQYVQKMKKYQFNIIPKSVYDIVMKQIQEVKKSTENCSKVFYIFPAPQNNHYPCRTQYYRNHMKEYMKKWGITNDDGTPYEFKSHAYRHTIASDLLNNYNIDLSIIQLGVLGHTEINMSLCYAERRKNRKQKYQTIYVDVDGNKNTLHESILSEENETYMALPNGLCINPSKLGICPHYEACLNCQHFRTSIDYLELHKQHYTALQKKLLIYEKNNLTINYITTKREIEGLEKIIDSLSNIQ